MTNEKVAQILKKQFKVEWIRLSELKIGQGYQRPVKPHKVGKIVAQFNPYLLAPMIVSKRDDDTVWVIDGQHRVTALREMGWHDQEVACQVLLGLTYEEEAALHGYYQTERSAHTPIELFLTFYEARRPTEVGIMRILGKYGLRIGNHAERREVTDTGGWVSAVAALRLVYLADPDLLDKTLGILTEAWDAGPDRVQGDIIRGVGLVLQHYPKTLDEKRLITVLGNTRPLSILNKSKEQRRINNAPFVHNVAAVIVSEYNYMKGGRKLPPATDLLRPHVPTMFSARGAKLTNEQKDEIRKVYMSTTTTNAELAKQYGVSTPTIALVTKGLKQLRKSK